MLLINKFIKIMLILLIFIIFLSFLTIININVQKSSANKNDNNINHNSENSIFITTNKLRYIPGESIILSGFINNDDPMSSTKKIIITLENSSHNIVFNSSLFANKTFSETILNTQNVGSYKVSATLNKSNETVLTTFEVLDPTTTISARILIVGGIVSIILIFILSFAFSGTRPLDIISFLLISIVGLAPIVALLLSDLSLGSNSPIGIVIKHPANEEGQIKLSNFGHNQKNRGQWVLNVEETNKIIILMEYKFLSLLSYLAL